MPTPAQIDEQIQLERDAIAQGLKKLHKNTRDLEGKDYASATVYGTASIDTLLPLVVARIEATTNRIKEGKQVQHLERYSSILLMLSHLLLQLSLLKSPLIRFSHTKKRTTKPPKYVSLLDLLLNKSVRCDTTKNMHPVY